MLIQQSIDLGNHGSLSYSRSARTGQFERSGCSARKTDMDQQLLTFDQGRICQQKLCQALAFSVWSVGITPQAWKIRSQGLQPEAQLFIELLLEIVTPVASR
jgi:hypothetical protein